MSLPESGIFSQVQQK